MWRKKLREVLLINKQAILIAGSNEAIVCFGYHEGLTCFLSQRPTISWPVILETMGQPWIENLLPSIDYPFYVMGE